MRWSALGFGESSSSEELSTVRFLALLILSQIYGKGIMPLLLSD